MVDGTDILDLGIPEGPLVGHALKVAKKTKGIPKRKVLDHIEDIFNQPEEYENVAEPFRPDADHENPYIVEEAFARKVKQWREKQERLQNMKPEEPKPFTVYAPHLTDTETYKQMRRAMKVPVAVRGALMPDAHLGYGLPVGGVWGLKDAVSPNAVGFDIGCRMHLSILDLEFDPYKKPLSEYQEQPLSEFFYDHRDKFEKALVENTSFGVGSEHEARDHPIVNDYRWDNLEYIDHMLENRALHQLGSSGGGNHFVNLGTVTVSEEDAFDLPPGLYLGVLSHFGSRGFGHKTAEHFKEIAEERCGDALTGEYKKLAWLSTKEDSGRRYWQAMQLAGDYAKAGHQIVHRLIADALGLRTLFSYDHHHNFAWKEKVGGEELVVHRKGATPAKKGQMGIIPSNMAERTHIVVGRGTEPIKSLNSCSHGAGRKMSRREAKDTLSQQERNRMLEENDVHLIGAEMDEAPGAYKSIHQVMQAQWDLVRPVGNFHPWIVRMA